MQRPFLIVPLNQQKHRTMKSLIKQLFFDKEMVEAMKVVKTDREVLYTQLINGKITMKEYIAVTSK